MPSSVPMLRLDKYLATVTDVSRFDAKRLIKAGQVTVAGVVNRDPRALVAATASLEWNGQALRTATPRYFMLHKPANCVSATVDREHMTALSLLREDNLEQLHIAGRLDIDTTGLLLITDDGQWSHRITAPRSDCQKTYWLETAEQIDPAVVTQLQLGVQLHNERRPTAPATMELLGSHCARLTITEGKYHQVKRMLAAVGNHVIRLHRERIGAIVLDPTLALGEYRALTAQEIGSV